MILNIKIDELKFPSNTKQYTEKQIINFAVAIRKWGIKHPIEIDKDNVIVDGVKRVLTYQYLGKRIIKAIRIL